MEAAMAGVEAPLMVAWELTGEGKERRGRGRGRRSLGGGLQGTPGEGTTAWFSPALACCCVVRSVSCMREETARGRRKKEERKEGKEKKTKKKRKKYGNFSKLENF
jgi:hypothetical protein